MSTAKEEVIPWLGQTPADWKVKPLYALGRQVRALNRGLVEDNLLSLSYGEIKRKDIEANFGLLPESFETYQVVESGDMVFRFTDLQNDQKSLRSALVKQRGIITNAYLGFRPKGIDSRYFNYLMRAYDLAGVFYSMGSGLRQSLNYSDVRRLPVVVPPLDEQRRIADFLDSETAKIDALIAKQEQLITTLDERRQALISQVIMRGLDKNSPVSTASIDHYEATPSSWSWVRLKDVAEVTPSNVDKKAYEGDIPVSLCNYVDVYYNELISADLNFMTATATPEEIRKFELKKGWVIITKDSEDASDIGIAAYVPEDLPNVVCGYHLSIVRPKDGVSGLFLKWFFDSTMTKGFMAKRSNGLTRMALGQGAISTLPICLPPFAEQVEIANYLLETTKKIDELIRNSRGVVGLLRERRQALISAAVTGQLEVGV